MDNEREPVIISAHEIREAEGFRQQNKDSLHAEAASEISGKMLLENYKIYRKKRTGRIVLFTGVGLAVILYAFFGMDSSDEMKLFKVVIAGCVLFGIGAGFALKSFLFSGRTLRHLGAEKENSFSACYETAFYDEMFTYRDLKNDNPLLAGKVFMVKYSDIEKILLTDEVLVLVDGNDIGVTVMYRDMPAGLDEWILGRCEKAKKIDKRTL